MFEHLGGQVAEGEAAGAFAGLGFEDRAVLARLEGEARTLPVFEHDDPRVLKWILSKATMVIGSRFHALVSVRDPVSTVNLRLAASPGRACRFDLSTGASYSSRESTPGPDVAWTEVANA